MKRKCVHCHLVPHFANDCEGRLTVYGPRLKITNSIQISSMGDKNVTPFTIHAAYKPHTSNKMKPELEPHKETRHSKIGHGVKTDI